MEEGVKLPGPSPYTVRWICASGFGAIVLLDIWLSLDGVTRNTISQATTDRALHAPFIVPAFVGMLAAWLPIHLFGGKRFNWKWAVGLALGIAFGICLAIFAPF
jgi:hypothetical protein